VHTLQDRQGDGTSANLPPPVARARRRGGMLLLLFALALVLPHHLVAAFALRWRETATRLRTGYRRLALSDRTIASSCRTRARWVSVENATLNLNYCRIISPSEGRVALRLVDPGNYIQASDPSGAVELPTAMMTTPQLSSEVAIHSSGRFHEIAAPSLKLLKLLAPKRCRRRNSRRDEVQQMRCTRYGARKGWGWPEPHNTRAGERC
jgi:hypothetical protein